MMNSQGTITGWALAILFFAGVSSSLNGQSSESGNFKRLAYRNPAAQPFLGVGLWAWPLPMDYDGDGDMDMVVSCPDVPFNGLYFFENRSGAKMPFFEPPVRIGEGEKNLQLSMVNGKAIVMGPGVEYDHFSKEGLDHPVQLYDAGPLEDQHQKLRFSQWKQVDFEGDGDLDLLAGIDDWGDYGWDNAFNAQGEWTNGPLHGWVYLMEKEGNSYREPIKLEAGGKPIDVYGAPSPNYYDFDSDGDLDLICGEFLDRFTWFENTGSREKPVFAEGRFLENEAGILHMHVEMITPAGVDWDGDGDIDLVVGDEDGRVAFLENTGQVEDRMPVFRSPVYFRQKAEHVKFGALVTPYSVDWDDDGDEDLISGNTSGNIAFIENLDGGDPPSWAEPVLQEVDGTPIRFMAGKQGSIQGPAEAKWGYTTLSVADWDGDGLKDIVVNSIWGKVEWIKNVGSTGKPELSAPQPVQVDWGTQKPPKPAWNWWDPAEHELATQWRTTPQAIDWNRDGLMDLVMLDHEGYLALFERKQMDDALWLSPGKRLFFGSNGAEFDRNNVPKDSTVSGPLRLNDAQAGSSGRRKWCFADWDADGDLDILINSRNCAWFENLGEENGMVFLAFRGDLSGDKLAGHTTSPAPVDWDKDGLPDLLLGAEDGFFYYLTNPGRETGK